LALVELVELLVGIGQVHLKIKGCGLGELLLCAGEPGEAVVECVCDTEIDHAPTTTGTAI
jgi:hypothetical protein